VVRGGPELEAGVVLRQLAGGTRGLRLWLRADGGHARYGGRRLVCQVVGPAVAVLQFLARTGAPRYRLARACACAHARVVQGCARTAQERRVRAHSRRVRVLTCALARLPVSSTSAGPIWSLKFHGDHVVTSSSDSTYVPTRTVACCSLLACEHEWRPNLVQRGASNYCHSCDPATVAAPRLVTANHRHTHPMSQPTSVTAVICSHHHLLSQGGLLTA